MFKILYDFNTCDVSFDHTDIDNDLILCAFDGDAAEKEKIPELYKNSDILNVLSSLNGCFAIALYNKITKELFFARDRLGEKQVYYSKKDEEIFVSTEFSEVFSYAGKRVNKTGLQHYMTFQYVPEPLTIGENVSALLSGHFVCVFADDMNETRYNTWKPAPVSDKDREKFKAEIRQKFEKAVKRNLENSKSPAAFLSGGLDSSILAALAARDHKNLAAYTISFDVPGFSESEIAENSAKKYGIEHKKVVIHANEYKEALPKTIKRMGVPVADPSAAAVYIIGSAAGIGHDTVISGEGSDELWGGYHVYSISDKEKKIKALPENVKKLLWGIVRHFPENMRGKDLIRRGCLPLELRFVGNTRLFTDSEKKKILVSYDENVKSTDITAPYYAEAATLSDLDKMQYIDTNIWFPGDICIVCNRAAESKDAKCVMPFMDNEITDLARTLTADEKLKPGQNKIILREAFSGIITDEVRDGKKRGYPVPVRMWLAGELNEWGKDVIRSSCVSEYINKKEALKILDKCKKHPHDPMYYRKAWAIIVFCIWYNVCVEGKNE